MRVLIITLATLFTNFVYGQTNNIIPKPAFADDLPGGFTLRESEVIRLEPGDSLQRAVATQFLHRLAASGFGSMRVSNQNGRIIFTKDSSLPPEAYRLRVDPSGIELTASSFGGYFYALQSLWQLSSDLRLYDSVSRKKYTPFFKSCSISDQPRFGYRGIMLDAARHFFPVWYVKKLLRVMSFYKYNRFHWHLTDDQGWRIEIKKYPLLTAVGATRKETAKGYYSFHEFDGQPYSGYYTQEQIREVVAYAKQLNIEVIPEIEMPGHSLAAIAAYPALSCDPSPTEVKTTWGVETNILCPTKYTFRFLEDVLTEVMALFPSRYIHVGGDEAPKLAWQKSAFCQSLIKEKGLKDEHELQSYFIKHIDSFLTSKGRRLIGWDEILEGGLSAGATVMSWRGTKGGIEAAKMKHDVIMSPYTYCYLDYAQGYMMDEPLSYRDMLPLDSVYAFDPVPATLAPDERRFIKGVQGNLWSEYVSGPTAADYQLFPRALALAENGWSEQKSYPDFLRRLKYHFGVLAKQGIKASTAYYDVQYEVKRRSMGKYFLSLKSKDSSLLIRYSDQVNAKSPQWQYYKSPIALSENSFIQVQPVSNSGAIMGKLTSRVFETSLLTGLPYQAEDVSKRYNGGSDYGLTNGIRGQIDNEFTWVAIGTDNLQFSIDAREQISPEQIQINFLKWQSGGILLPTQLKIEVSADGKTYRTVYLAPIENKLYPAKYIYTVSVDNPGAFRYLKVFGKNYGKLDTNYYNQSNRSSIWLDEVFVK